MPFMMSDYYDAQKAQAGGELAQLELAGYKKQLADQAEAEKTYAEAQKTQPTMVGGYQDQKGPPSLAQGILPGESGGMPTKSPLGGAPMPSFMGGAKAEEAAKQPVTPEAPATPMEKMKSSQNEVEGLKGVLQRNTNAIKLANAKGNYKLANALALQNEELQINHDKAQINHLSNVQTTLELGGQLVRGYEAEVKANPADSEGAWARFVLKAQSELGATGDELMRARTPQERAAMVENLKGRAEKGTDVLKSQKTQLEFEYKQKEQERKIERAQELNKLAEQKLQLQKEGMADKANLIQAKIDQLKILGELEKARTDQTKAKQGAGIGPTAFLKNTIGDSSGDAKIDQNITNTGSAIVAADHLLDKLKDPEIRTGAQLSLKTIQNRIKGLSDDKEITEDDIKNFVEGSVEPTAKNAAFRKEALYTAFEIEKEAQGGRLTVQMMKMGGSALDPTKYTKEGYGAVLGTRRKDLYRKLDGWNLDVDQKEKLVGKLSEKAPPMKTTETPSVTSKQQYDALPSGAIYIEDDKKYRKP